MLRRNKDVPTSIHFLYRGERGSYVTLDQDPEGDAQLKERILAGRDRSPAPRLYVVVRARYLGTGGGLVHLFTDGKVLP